MATNEEPSGPKPGAKAWPVGVEAGIVRQQRKARKLSEELADLQTRAATRAVTLREVIYVMRGRAYLLVVVVLTLPFLTPIPVPGLSTAFGLAIAAIALRLALGQRAWLPARLQRKELPSGFFTRLLKVAKWIIRLFEKFLRPRLFPLTNTAFLRQLHAILLLVAALVLLLPLPIPFTNSFPAWTILLLAGGLLERDGAAILLGYVVFAAGVFYFLFLGEAAAQLFDALVHWLRT
ncbi:MAG: exopolysaccharide biosynthesis protein [Candidatus Didemnitutus sp.]|nr:exopolysaccharide biosynthesis protein [Candidatus Didemnitutus sp.]